MITKILTITTILLLLLVGCGKKEDVSKTKETRKVAETEKKVDTVDTKSAINLKSIDGKEIKLTALKNGIKFENYPNKIVLLDFFATWCPPCKAEIPHLNIIQDVFKDHVQIIGVLMEESKSNEEVEIFKDNLKVNFPITNSPQNFQLSDALGGIKSLPTMVMYDKNGEYYTHYVGAAPQEMIEADIQKAIEKTK